MRDPGRRRSRLAWTIAALCIAGGSAGAGVVVAGASAVAYRTALARTASVESTLTVQGKVEPEARATADFGASGTVSAVDVRQGETVRAGETLATLVPTSLEEAVTAAKATLEAAEAKLASDEESESSSVTTTTAAAGSSAGTTSTSSASSALSAAQATVVADQRKLDAAQEVVSTHLLAAKETCDESSEAGSSSTSGSTTASATDAAAISAGSVSGAEGSPVTSSSSDSDTDSASTTCRSELSTALAAEATVSRDERALTRAESSLASLFSSESATSAAAAGSSDSSSAAGASDSKATADDPSSSSETVTAATLAQDQESIDDDRASLFAAQASLAARDLVTPISGTVAAVDLSVDESVTAGSTSDAITVISAGSFEATATLTESEAAQVAVGDSVRVSVVGISGALKGTVTRVGPVDVSGGNTYPLVVSLSTGADDIYTGTSAEISVVLKRLEDVLAVPTSAVRTRSSGHSTVEELSNGQVRDVPVKVGVVGDLYTEVLAGVAKGARVVLADESSPVPTSNTTSSFGGVSALDGNTSTFQGGTGAGVGRFSPKG